MIADVNANNADQIFTNVKCFCMVLSVLITFYLQQEFVLIQLV
jgi:hypothetical protein